MTDRICTSAGCSTMVGLSGARGMCPRHYRFWRKTQPPPPTRPCVLDGCIKPQVGNGHCAMHRNRLMRTGSFELRPKVQKVCWADGCEAFGRSYGLCSKHGARWYRNGRIEALNGVEARGEKSSQWAGDAVTYRTVHSRLNQCYGKASGYRCEDCGGRAQQWSYDGRSDREQIDPKNHMRYTTDLEHYASRCLRCHHRYDGHWPESCPRGHLYAGANLIVVPRDGSRRCRTCKRAWQRENYHRRRQLAARPAG